VVDILIKLYVNGVWFGSN